MFLYGHNFVFYSAIFAVVAVGRMRQIGLRGVRRGGKEATLHYVHYPDKNVVEKSAPWPEQ